LDVFFFAFFAFFAMLPSVIPSWLNASRHSTRMHSDYITIAKLILRASKKVNDCHAVATTVKVLRPRGSRKPYRW
jgi:hypothetical protein